jgi:hypothetical protein
MIFYFSLILESCISGSSEVILNLSKDLKALSMLFLQYFMINLVLTKSSGPKSHAVLLTAPIFTGFCVSHTDLDGGCSSL